MSKKLILFVCTENRFRSPLAEYYFLSQLIMDSRMAEISVTSAGTRAVPGRGAIDLLLNDPQLNAGGHFTRHKAKLIDSALVDQASLIITMEVNQKEALRVEYPAYRFKIKTLSQLADGIEYDINDLNNELEFDRTIMAELKMLVRRAYPGILRAVNPRHVADS